VDEAVHDSFASVEPWKEVFKDHGVIRGVTAIDAVSDDVRCLRKPRGLAVEEERHLG
jgi:hypothetical protein